ncbi:hypothetical protein AB4F67_004647 [Salmonella enterica subsp. enterica]
MGHEPEWKVEKQPRWLVAAIKKTISSLHGGYEEAAEWLDVTKDALFNRLRTGGDQIFPIGWALVLQRAGGTYHLAHSVARASGGVFVPLQIWKKWITQILISACWKRLSRSPVIPSKSG